MSDRLFAATIFFLSLVGMGILGWQLVIISKMLSHITELIVRTH